MLPEAEPSPNFVVCGDNPLVYQLALQLTTRFADASVTVVLSNRSGGFVPRLAELERVRIVVAERLDEATLRAVGVASARALALVDQADVGNFHTALRAYEINPEIRLVIRMFNTGLGFRIRRLFTDCVVLSMSAMAAPSFIAAALGENALDYLRLAECTLYVSRSGAAGPGRVVCGLADGPDGITLRPRAKPGDRVLALTTRVPYSPGARRRWLGLMRYLVRHELIRLLLVLLGVIAIGCGLLVAIGIGWGEAVYESLLDAAGDAAPEPQRQTLFKALQLAITFTGLAMTPVITALVVGGVLRAQLAESTTPDPARFDDHVVVAGLGNVGMRVMEQLSDLGVRVVGLDHDENARGITLARTLGVPVVIGQVTWEDALHKAGVSRARALVLATNSDAINLEAALLGQSLRDDLRLVLRLSDDDLADRVQQTLAKAVVRSVFQLAVGGFADAMAERRVIASLRVDNETLLVAEIPVESGSALAGQPLTAANLPGRVQVVGLHRDPSTVPDWQPEPETILAVDNQVVVVTTRAGLTELLERSSGVVVG